MELQSVTNMSKKQVLKQIYPDEIDLYIERDILDQMQFISQIGAALGASDDNDNSYLDTLQEEYNRLQDDNKQSNEEKTKEEIEQELEKLKAMFG